MTKSKERNTGKNFALLFRSLINTASFTCLCYGVVLIEKGDINGGIFTAAGGLATGICLVCNLIIPLSRNKKIL